MRRPIAVFMVLALSICPVATLAADGESPTGTFGPVQEEEHNTRMRQAIDLLNAGDLAGARGILERLLEDETRLLGPDHTRTLITTSNLAETLRRQGDLARARDLQQQVVEDLTGVLGPEHDRTLTATNNLALTVGAQGDLPAARELQEQVLEARTRTLGPEHPDTLTSMGNLASTLASQGDLAGALDLYEQLADVRTRTLGPEHPDTLASMDSVVAMMWDQGVRADAQALHEQIFETRSTSLGPEHPETLTSRNTLAAFRFFQGDVTGARDLLEQVLEARTRILGPEHPDTLGTRDFMSRVQAALDEASAENEPIDVPGEFIGFGHVETPEHGYAITFPADWAVVERDVREVRGAPLVTHWLHAFRPASEESCQVTLEPGRDLSAEMVGQALADELSATYGELIADGPDLSVTALPVGLVARLELTIGADDRLLASSYYVYNDPAKLLTMMCLAADRPADDWLSIAETLEFLPAVESDAMEDPPAGTFGPEQREELDAKYDQAATLFDQGDYAGAHDLLEQVLKAEVRILGPGHPDTLRTMSDLAETLRRRGVLVGARNLFERVVEAHTRTLGPDHPDTLIAKGNVALTLETQGDLAGARDLLEQVVEGLTRTLGPEHPDTLATKAILASVLAAPGEASPGDGPIDEDDVISVGAWDEHQRMWLQKLNELGPRVGRAKTLPQLRRALGNIQRHFKGETTWLRKNADRFAPDSCLGADRTDWAKRVKQARRILDKAVTDTRRGNVDAASSSLRRFDRAVRGIFEVYNAGRC